uniref:T-complex protein 1 subunit gamma n=2 Tax=Aegilops tauschii subsp. strangulata TaxID=200361 RepID=A0A453S6I8_AEGTS
TLVATRVSLESPNRTNPRARKIARRSKHPPPHSLLPPSAPPPRRLASRQIAMALHAPVLVLKDSLKRESGAKVQHGNIQAAKAVSDIIRTTLGPRSMLKMLLDASGGIVVTNDGNAILRELDIAHPAAKSMIELSRTQDEEVGDGTTSVIVLAGEMLHVAETFIEKNYHPTVICRGSYLMLSLYNYIYYSSFGDLCICS